jgi:uncharacterized protein (DUF1684 family)
MIERESSAWRRCGGLAAALILAAAFAAASSALEAAWPAGSPRILARTSAGGAANTPSTAAAGAGAASAPAGAPASGTNGSPAAPAPAAAIASTVLDSSPEACLREVAAWRAERAAGLKSVNGWLTLTGLFWLEEGDNRFGSDSANRVVLPAGKAPSFAGTLVRHGQEVTVRAQPGAGLSSDGKPVAEMKLAFGTQKATVLSLGSLSFFVIDRGGRLGVRVKDSQSAALAAFHGIESYPIDASWRVVARFEPHAQPKSIPITNILGMTEDQPSPGVVTFERGGKTYRIDALSESNDGSLFLIFADQTSGSETYGAGRFLDTGAPRDGRLVVDFNEAYNPPCAFTSFATCPLPPPQNHLALAITAGEKKYAGAAH